MHTLLRSSCEEESTDLAFMSPCDSKSCWVNEAVSPVAFQVPNLIPRVLGKTFLDAIESSLILFSSTNLTTFT